nr:TetR/AcrR family transcriptional regulator [Micrococcus luteus]
MLAECVELFNRHGYEATSMGMLAAHLGISKSAIYHHVESKEAILDHAVTEALDALEACLDDVVASGADAGAQVEAAIRGTLGVLAEKQPEVTLLLRLRGNSAVEVAAVERRREITRRLGDLLEAAQAAGAVRSDVTPRNLARLALGMINSIVDWYRPDRGVPGQQGPDQMIDAVTGVVLGGLRG